MQVTHHRSGDFPVSEAGKSELYGCRAQGVTRSHARRRSKPQDLEWGQRDRLEVSLL